MNDEGWISYADSRTPEYAEQWGNADPPLWDGDHDTNPASVEHCKLCGFWDPARSLSPVTDMRLPEAHDMDCPWRIVTEWIAAGRPDMPQFHQGIFG